MSNPDVQEQYRRATEVQSKYADMLLGLPHVVGLGVGFAHRDGAQTPYVALIVMVDEKLPRASLAPEDLIPAELDGVRVDVQAMGGFAAFDTD